MFKNPLLGKRGFPFVVLSLLFLAGGCGSYQNQSPSITISVSPQKTAIGTGQSTQFSASGDPSGVTWSVAGFTNAGAGTAAPAGTVDASGNYTAPSGSQSLVVTVTATSKTDPAESSSATVNVVAPGQVTATNNVEVAQYTISPAASANVSVQFGTDTTYGLTTWTQPAGQRGGAVSLYVAGMKASTLYHMRGVVQFTDGTQFTDADRTFTTGALPTAMLPTLTAATTTGMTPQSGVELLDLVQIGAMTNQFPVVLTDLAGNVIWNYNAGVSQVVVNPIKLLPNGHFLLNFSGASADGVNSSCRK